MFKSMLLGAAAMVGAAVLPVYANDSVAEVATGGLVFVHSDDVEMQAEDLFISAKEIRVRYRFFNKSNQDVTLLVAFPLPEVRASEYGDGSLPADFATSVNGRSVTTQVEQRAFALGIDRTPYLRDLGIPLDPQLAATNQALDRLAPEKQEQLLRLGLAAIEEYDAGAGMQKHLAARWGLSTTFYWEQTFPARNETLIEHRYRPSVGGTVQTALGEPAMTNEPWYDLYRRKYCIDKDFYAAVERKRKAAGNEYGAPYAEERIDYILRTGANWSGPIKDFRLVVDKGHAGNLVTFCGEGVKKIGPTQFEMRKTDFIPEGDLSVLILTKYR